MYGEIKVGMSGLRLLACLPRGENKLNLTGNIPGSIRRRCTILENAGWSP